MTVHLHHFIGSCNKVIEFPGTFTWPVIILMAASARRVVSSWRKIWPHDMCTENTYDILKKNKSAFFVKYIEMESKKNNRISLAYHTFRMHAVLESLLLLLLLWLWFNPFMPFTPFIPLVPFSLFHSLSFRRFLFRNLQLRDVQYQQAMGTNQWTPKFASLLWLETCSCQVSLKSLW